MGLMTCVPEQDVEEMTPRVTAPAQFRGLQHLATEQLSALPPAMTHTRVSSLCVVRAGQEMPASRQVWVVGVGGPGLLRLQHWLLQSSTLWHVGDKGVARVVYPLGQA